MGMTDLQSIQKFNERRALNNIGIRKPSQLRFIKYFYWFLLDNLGINTVERVSGGIE